MADVIEGTQQEFWKAPSALAAVGPVAVAAEVQQLAEVCNRCGSEFMIAASFCHTCGLKRPALLKTITDHPDAVIVSSLWLKNVIRMQNGLNWAGSSWRAIPFPAWLRYLHFHEIKRWVGLPTAALISFIVGLGCIAGAVGVSVFYKASNLAEFQAIQMWRIEWLLGATASFVAGILLKNPSERE